MSGGDPRDEPPPFDDAPLPSEFDQFDQFDEGGGGDGGGPGWDDAPMPEDDGFQPITDEAAAWIGADESPPVGFDEGPPAGRAAAPQRQAGDGSGGGGRPPSEKQLAFARKLAAERGIELPEGALESGPACSRFIDAALKQPPKEGARPSGGSGRPATEKQVAFARKLAAERGVEVPKEALESSTECSRFIDAQLGKKPTGPGRAPPAAAGGATPASGSPSGPRPPTPRQLAFAKKLSTEKGMELTDADLADSRAISRFIDRALGKG